MPVLVPNHSKQQRRQTQRTAVDGMRLPVAHVQVLDAPNHRAELQGGVEPEQQAVAVEQHVAHASAHGEGRGAIDALGAVAEDEPRKLLLRLWLWVVVED